MRTAALLATIALLLCFAPNRGAAADNELTPEEKAAGWQLLFNGKDFDGWECNDGKPVASKIEDGCLVPLKSGGYLVVYKKQRFGDFIFKCDVKMETDRCNSGIFFRTGDVKNPVQTGFEMQIGSGKGTSMHDFASIYDAAAPSKNMITDPKKWYAITITCKGPLVAIAIDGETVTRMNCDEYTEPGKNPDGTKNKFNKPIKDFSREGYFGFQDHHDGTKAIYKNIKILDLTKSKGAAKDG